MRLRVLIVDDEPDHAEMLAEYIAELGHHAAIADSVAEARARATETAFDLILVDFVLPDGRGDLLASELRALGVRSRIVATTASGAKRERERSASAGIDAFLLKPFSLDKIRAELEYVASR